MNLRSPILLFRPRPNQRRLINLPRNRIFPEWKVKAAAAQGKNNQVPIGIPISSQQWDVISAEAAKTANPEETVNKYVAAITYAREYGMEVPAAMQSLEQLNQYQLGKAYQPTRTNTQSIANSFKVSSLTKNKMDLAIAFRRADLAGGCITQLSQQIQGIGSADIIIAG